MTTSWPSWLPLLPAWLEPTASRASHLAGAWARFALGWLEHHSGVPAIVLAAVLLVVGWRLAKKVARFVVEVVVVLVVLVALTQLGVLRF
ncbi:MAG: hypothetical protein JNL38_33425 [Myxococcales bacterium]|jgi:hypothetical protein|nr:hypothetical protein [Myxococcales bacterium]